MDDEEERYCLIWGKGQSNANDEIDWVPRLIKELDNKEIDKLSCGFNHCLAMSTTYGNVYSWGSNNFGQLGHGNKDSRKSPKNIQQFSLLKALKADEKLVDVCAGKDFSIGISSQGNIYGFGISNEGQLANGRSNTTNGGSLHNSVGSLSGSSSSVTGGIGGLSNSGSSIFSSSLNISGTGHITHIELDNSLILSSQLTSYSQYHNKQQKESQQQNQIDNAKRIQLLPKRITSLLPDTFISKISCGSNHILALDRDGNVYGWGGRLCSGHQEGDISTASQIRPGDYIEIPLRIKSLCKIISIACGWTHSMVLDNRGNLLTWGIGKDGQLGNGKRDTVSRPTLLPQLIESPILSIACGAFHSAVIAGNKRSLYCFGWRISTGLGGTVDVLSPTLVDSLGNYRIYEISCGYSHTLILTESGELFSTGEGLNGQLGHGKLGNSGALIKPIPSMIIPLSKEYFVTSISTNRYQSLAVVKKRKFLTSVDLLNKYGINYKEKDSDDLNIDEIENLINTSPLFKDTEENDDIFKMNDDNNSSLNNFIKRVGSDLKLVNSMDQLNGEDDELSMMILNLEKELSEFILLDDTVEGNINIHDSSNNSVESDYELLEIDDVENEPIIIKKPFYDKYLNLFNGGGAGELRRNLNGSGGSNYNFQNPNQLSYNNQDLDDNQNLNLCDLWLNKFLPKFDQRKSEKEWKNLWRRGFPSSVRSTLWKRAIGNKLGITDALCKELLEKIRFFNSISCDKEVENSIHQSTEYKHYLLTLNMIRVDLPRTFPHLKLFHERGPYHETLSNALMMFSLFRQDIGYVQGMSYLCGVITLVMDSTIDIFISFTNLLNNHFFTSLFKMDINGMVKHMRIFDYLFQTQLPRLHKKFKDLSITPEYYLLEWFMTLFTKQLPLPICLRIWDCFLMEGQVFIFSTCIGILKSLRKLIIDKSSFEESIDILKTIIQDFKEERLFSSIQSIHVPKFIKKFINTINNDV